MASLQSKPWHCLNILAKFLAVLAVISHISGNFFLSKYGGGNKG